MVDPEVTAGRPSTAARNAPELPRVAAILARERRASEILIAWVQLSIVGMTAGLYLLSPQAFHSMTAFEPVPIVLAAYLGFTLVRLGLAYRFDLPGLLIAAFIVLDFALLYGLIASYPLQYGQPPGFALKAPTLLYVFVFIALRGLRFEPLFVVFSGLVAAAGWLALALYAAFGAENAEVTRSFVRHMTSNAVLIGADVDRVFAILLATGVTTLVIVRSRRQLMAAAYGQTAAGDLSRFFSPGVVARILETETLKAGVGEVRQASILITDIRGFTPLAATMPPTEVVALLSDYQRRVGRAIQDAGGAIDKFMGDGILATFGCVDDRSTPAADALRAALAVTDLTLPGLRIGVAVASGPVVFGTVGDGVRLEYTVIGEAVNLAVKLEKHNKEVRAAAMTDRATYERALAEGFEPPPGSRDLNGERVGGVRDPIDLVVLRPDEPGG